MTRRWLFGGLTIILIAVLIGLIIQGNKLEKQKANQPIEIIQESKPTPTRVLAPKDLELLQSKMRIDPGPDQDNQINIARHDLEIRNGGTVPYEKIQLSFDYLDHNGKVLATHTSSIEQTILPGSTLYFSDIEIDDVPLSAVDFKVLIVFADIGDAPVSAN